MFRERIIMGLEQSEQTTFQYGTILNQPISGSPIRKTPGFIEYDTIIDDGVRNEYLHVENQTTLTGLTSHVKFDHEGNIYIAGRVPSPIKWQGQFLPFQGGNYDLFIAKWGAPGCPVPEQPCVSIPDQLSVDSLHAGHAVISWQSTNSDSLWNLEYGISGFTQGTGNLMSGLTQPSATLNNLQPGTSYTVYVQDSCSGNESGPWSDSLSFTTPYPPCPAPQNLSAADITEESALLTWQGVPDALDYTVEWGESGFSLGSGDTVVTQDTAQQLTLLNPETEYHAYVTARCQGDSTSQPLGPEAFTTLPQDTNINTVGVKDTDTEFNLYPNPARNVLNLEYLQAEDAELLIYSVSGQLVYSQNGLADEGRLEVNTSQWPAGMYLVHFKTSGGVSEVVKVSVVD